MRDPSAFATTARRFTDSSIAATNSSSLIGFSQEHQTRSRLGALPGWRAAGDGKADGEFAWER